MRIFVHQIFILVSKFIMPIFFNKEFLKGRWFENNIEGWKWCWRSLLFQKMLGMNRHVPFPVSHNNIIGKIDNIYFNVNDMNNFQHMGCYFQNWSGGKIIIGEGTYIAPNVGLITENHNFYHLDAHDEPKDIIIGKDCWIGMNVVILPGVKLGNHTIVGAGAVVTRSFEEGNCVIGGVAAKKIKDLEKQLVSKLNN
ncbi:acyltransferase [Sporosarcina aquimarina]|uniref:acyltransferase n=1 Tax=Sporosarcina aquimarina TaxID=114975 RepID=UPI00203D438C|nr:acyltransferase [Sporosarcina aquimarina]MCM3756323.1 acyltransferase [Sporosarcina aquimarina]